VVLGGVEPEHVVYFSLDLFLGGDGHIAIVRVQESERLLAYLDVFVL
jgi:hypothetical protein